MLTAGSSAPRYAAPQERASGASTGGAEHTCILVVDDRGDKRMGIASALSGLDYPIVFAESGMDALRQLLRDDFAVILLDMKMPEMDGIELARIIRSRKRTAKIPIIFYTADSDAAQKYLSEAYALGAVDLLVSPVPGEVLCAKVVVYADFHRRLAHQRRIAGERERLLRAEAARAEAERASAAKDHFMAMLSHELRTPLSPVLNTIELLLHSDEPAANLREHLETIRRNVVLEARLIDDLLDLTMVSRGKLRLHRECVDVGDALQSVLQICQPELAQKQITLTVSTTLTQRVVRADSARLKQVLWNVIRNALKHTDAGGKIVVSLSNTPDERILIQVKDDGSGISHQLLPNIFDAFRQGHHSAGGLGLGLAISRSIIELHGGTIEAQSDGRGCGATFSIFLPTEGCVTPVPPGAEGEKPGLVPPSMVRRLGTLLLVEDHPDTRHSLQRLLLRRGYAVESAGDVREAVALSQASSFDVIISDIGLPDGSGYDFISQVSKEDRLFSIALSGYGMEGDIARSHQAGFARHLTKPVDFEELDEAIQDLLRTRRS